MPHGGRTFDELVAAGVRDVEILQHAAMSEPAPGDTPLDDAANQLIADQLGEDATDGGPPSTTTTTDVSVGRQTDVSVLEESQRTSDFITNQTIQTFVDVPTAEELFNDFTTGFQAAIGSQLQTGAISAQDADLAIRDIGFFAMEYFTEIRAMADRGEEIFQVVGVEGDPEFLGERTGGTRTEETTGTIEEDSKRQTEETSQQTTTEQTQQAAPEGGETAEGTRTGVETVDVTEESTTETESRRGIDETRTNETTEEVFRRPKIASVFTLSPEEFIEKGRTPAQLSNLLRSRERERGHAPRAAVTGTRRT